MSSNDLYGISTTGHTLSSNMNRRRALSRQGSLKTHHPSSPFMITPELLAYLASAAPRAPVRERSRRPIENMIGGYVRSLRASRTVIGTTLPVDLSQVDMGLFKAALAAHPDGAKLVPRAKDIWRSLPPSERARWCSPSVTPGSVTSSLRDIDSTSALRRARTDPYPSPSQNGPRRSQRQTTYRQPILTSPVTPTMGYGDRHNMMLATTKASRRQIPPPPRPAPVTIPPRQRIPPSDPLGLAPFDERNAGSSSHPVPREYDNFEYQEPFLDVPIPFEAALPKGFQPLSPLMTATFSREYDLVTNAFGRSAEWNLPPLRMSASACAEWMRATRI